ncbi:FliI/YscN family ATPase [Endozoicomonas sp. 8E]|uniref:FliI/YscN family ATPase n=1 Tax=Endozoicomonas sp. 8E TaxID=3035692 RepID=UPI002939175B|nr:FliI/YscN family ATPase [Endozoicomonas sp. 8E]WOG29085.1 FliI/YscN family ATPase [Endozoicomonas sp. 8E]
MPLSDDLIEKLKTVPVAKLSGKISAIKGLLLEAQGLRLPIGQLCHINMRSGRQVEAEVVGFDGASQFLMPLSTTMEGLAAGDRIIPVSLNHTMPVGEELLGRVVDAMGKPLDSSALTLSDRISIHSPPLNPMIRRPVDEPLEVGVRVIDSLLTLGKGQRVGLFAGSGVGKSTLMGMMTRNTRADVTVVGLIGERSREVKEFVDQILGMEGREKAVVVASPGDESPVRRIRAALYCHQIAEYFRDQGKSVLLLMDSLTRYAQAHREIALAVGEAPAAKGFPPSVFSKIPILLERAGTGTGEGSVTAIYTVLAEGDDMQEPVVDTARSILDGHIVLSRELAERGHFPAIDLEASISRTMSQLITEEHETCAQVFRRYHARYNEFRELMAIGAYKPGADPELDKAIEHRPQMERFLQQSRYEQVDLSGSVQQLINIWQPDQVVTS